MATQNINIGVNVSDNGTAKKTVKNFQEITAAATQAQRAAAGINAPGGTSGSRMVAARAAPGGSQGMSGEQYGSARGSAGLTGASARDFANQAQGLGGLVRLYATYAANVFAVSAAFTALSNAADTANLVKGMNQIGAASGVALGTLSKRLVEVTDGAISMREAMETVTKGISSGMSTKQILEIGNVAKKASQALGVDMTDAVSRLSRGITKLEPELLDELGIFTKIDPAVQKYAQSIGRAANSLSDFERRQAFAIAVLEEGNKKFGAIELDANPYAKFLATLKDVGFTVLDVVNKAVVPLVSYLSQSPTALLTVLGAVGAIIVRQALPAFGQFRAGLESAAESAKERAIARAQDAAAAQDAIAESVKQAADARVESQVAKVVAAESRIKEIKSGSIKKQSALYKILEKDLEDITEKDLKRMETTAKGLETRGLKDQAKAYRDTASAVRDYQLESTRYQKALENEEQRRTKALKWYSIESITMETAERAKTQAVRASIVSNAAYQASLVGVTRAMIATNAAITKAGITGFAAFTLQVKAGAAAIGGALATIGTAINRLLGVVGILLTAYSILDSFLDGASKEIGNFDSAVDKANSSAEALSKTYETIYKNDPFSAQSVQARGTALMEVADGFAEIAKTARDAQKAIDQSWWAQLKEGIGLSGVNRNFGKSIATQLTSILKNIDDPQAKKFLEDTAKKQLGITELSFDNVAAAAKRVGAASPEIKKLQDSITGLATQSKIAGAATLQFSESYKKVTDQIEKINQKFGVTDDIAVFAINSANALTDLDTLLSQGVTKSADGLVTALKGIGQGSNIFGELGSQLIPLADDASAFKTQMSEAQKEVVNLGKELEDLKSKKINRADFTTEFLGQSSFDQQGFDKAIAELERQRRETASSIVAAQKRTDKAKADLETVAARVQQALPQALASSTEKLNNRLSAEFAKGATTALQGAYASFDAIPELVAKSSQLKLREIDAQIANTKELRNLTTATVLSAAQQKVANAEEGVKRAQDSGTAGRDFAMTGLREAREELKLLEQAIANPSKALKELAEGQRSGSITNKQFASTIRQMAAETFQFNAAIRQSQQQKSSEAIAGDVNVISAVFKQQQQRRKVTQDELKLEGERLQVLQAQSNIGLDAKQQLVDQIAVNRQKQVELVLEDRLAEAAKNYAQQATKARALPAADRAVANKQSTDIFYNEQQLATAQEAQEIEKIRLDTLKAQTSIVLERLEKESQAAARRAELDKVALDSSIQLGQIKFDTEQSVESAILNNLDLSASARAEIEYQASLRTAAYDRDRVSIQSNAEFERQSAENLAKMKKIYAADTGEDGLTQGTQEAIQAILDQEALQKANRDVAIVQATALYDKNVAIADVTRTIGQEQAHYNSLIENSNTLANTLAQTFTNLGSQLGSVVTAFTEMAVASDKNAKALNAMGAKVEELYSTGKIEEAKNLEKEYFTEKKKGQAAEIAGAAKIAGATKTLFKEKTFAYKAFNALEKALHVVSIAMSIQRIYQENAETIAAGAATAKRVALKVYEAGVSAVGSVIDAIKGPFPMNIIAGAATAAVVYGLVKAIGGSGGPGVSGGGGFVPNAEQRQETQGTAMGYDAQGNKVQVRRGVFGDTDAKSESIANSLEIIKDNSVDGLSYDNRMLSLLASIDSGINKTARGLYGIQGLRSGSMLNTVEGKQSGGGLLGTGLFGSKTSRNITDSGLIIEGTFAQLASDTNAAVIDFFEQVTVSKKKWYGKTKTWVETKRTEIDEATSEFFQDIFSNATQMFIETGARAGVDASAINQILGSMDVGQNFASLRGLKGEDFEKELSAIIGTVLDDAASAIFTSFETFAQFGEGMLETVVRVIDTNDKINQQIKNVGIDISPLGFAITESLAELAGGLENFLDQTNFFRENFLTEAERLAPVQKSVTGEMARLGFASVTTREGFKQLVQSLDLTTDAGRENFQALMNVAEGFDKVAKAAEDFNSKAKSMQMRILELTGTPEQLLAAQRRQTVEDTDAGLRATQQYIFALEDIQAAEDALTKARQAEANSIKEQQKTTEGLVNNIKRYIDSIRKFKDSLLLNAASPLTPAQKYAESKRQFDAILATATGTAATPEEQSAKDAALGQLEGSASAFLEASKVYNASSDQYMTDFSYIQQALTQTSDALSTQLSVEEKSLSALNAQVSALETVNTSVLSVAEAVNRLIVAQQQAEQLKVASESSLVQNPAYLTDQINTLYKKYENRNADSEGIRYWSSEITSNRANLSTLEEALSLATGIPKFAMGTNFVPEDMLAQIHKGERIIPAADNAQLMQNLNSRDEANRVLVAEIRNLRSEVKQLREQQAAETGSIIVANFDAQQRAAEQIGTAMTNTAQQSTWTAKVREGVKLK
jgi:hypothetical protein